MLALSKNAVVVNEEILHLRGRFTFHQFFGFNLCVYFFNFCLLLCFGLWKNLQEILKQNNVFGNLEIYYITSCWLCFSIMFLTQLLFFLHIYSSVFVIINANTQLNPQIFLQASVDIQFKLKTISKSDYPGNYQRILHI